MFDIVITGGLLVDGSGEPASQADLGIEGEKISAVGDLKAAESRRVIDATGLAITPGFIDMHTHSDLPLLVDPRGLSKIHQGVTTEVVGNCGSGVFPVTQEHLPQLRAHNTFGDAVEWTWTDLKGYRDAVMQRGVGVNVAPLLGHTCVRGTVVGFEERLPTPDDIRAMQRVVDEAMDQGAFGLSVGLVYPPSAFATTEELALVSEPMTRYPGRFYSSHSRSWPGKEFGGTEEAIEVGRRARVPVQLSHAGISNPRHWGEADKYLAICQQAVDEGVDVTYDVYPYIAGCGRFSQFMPRWAQSGGRPALAERLKDPVARDRIRADMAVSGPHQGSWHWDRMIVSEVFNEDTKQYEGMSIQQVAEAMGCDPLDAAISLMRQNDARMRGIYFSKSEDDVRAFLKHPLGMIGSDGYALAPFGRLGNGKPHPRAYGTYPRLLGRYVREDRVLTLGQAVHKMTGQVADKLGVRDRGRLAPDKAADIVIFDPATVMDRADFQNPHQYPDGIAYVLVNGRIAVEGGHHTGTLAGRVLEPN